MPKPFETKSIKTWKSLLRYGDQMSSGWVFRGQRDGGWFICSSLERLANSLKVPLADRSKLERALLREFQRSVPAQAHASISPESRLEWIALMQHYGAPTRMVDFTYSMYVAVYFALEFSGPPQIVPSAIWCINREWLLESSVNALKAAKRRGTQHLKTFLGPEGDELAFDLHFTGKAVDCITNLNPFRLNERLRIQKGLFLIPGSTSKTFNSILDALPESHAPENVLCLELAPDLRQDALERLHYMNIGRTTLFPGFDGYAQSLSVFHPVHKRILWS